MNGKESEFWTGVAQALNPGWKIRLGSAWEPGSGGGGRHDLYVYAIDVSTGWICLAGMPTAEALRLINETGKREPCLKEAQGFVAQAIAEVGQMSTEAASEAQEGVMVATTMALSTTKSFELANPGQDGLTTHCLYLSYKGRDGSFIGRPAVIKSKVDGAVPPLELHAFLRKIVGGDTSGPPLSDVARTITKCGGAAVAREFC